MTEISPDPLTDLYATRCGGMSASEVRALFAVASRPDVVSLAGGMPFVQALPAQDVLAVVHSVIEENASQALQYCGGGGLPGVRRAVTALMAGGGGDAPPDAGVVTNSAQQNPGIVGKNFPCPRDRGVVGGPPPAGG